MFSVGAGSKVTDQVPSPLSVAMGPPAGSQPQNGPVKRTESAAAPQRSTVATKTDGATEQDPSVVHSPKQVLMTVSPVTGSKIRSSKLPGSARLTRQVFFYSPIGTIVGAVQEDG